MPSATEIVHALGAGPQLVGRSEECDFPAEVRALPVVMRARALDSELDSADIDARVRSSREKGEGLYTLDLAALRSLRPDIIFTQDLCGVCSVTEDEVRRACRDVGVAPAIISLTPRTLDDVWDSIEIVGGAIGRRDVAASVAATLRRRSAPQPPGGVERPKVAVVEWLDPPILAGLWTPEIVLRAGGSPLGPGPGEIGQRLSWEELATLRPEAVVISPCSFSVARSRAELQRLAVRPEVAKLVARVPTLLADEAYFSRPGPRLADGVDLVREFLGGRIARGPMPVERWLPTRGAVAA